MARVFERSGLAAAFAILLSVTACNDPRSPNSPKPDAALAPLDATLAINVQSADWCKGACIDPDGYTAWLDDSRSQAVASNGLVTFGGVAAGDHKVALTGVALNCSLNELTTVTTSANNPRPVSSTGGVAGTTDFFMGCLNGGDLFVSTNTTGVDLDADGYTITADGGASQPIATNGGVSFVGLVTGDHSVALSGVAQNCTVSGANQQTVTVQMGATASTTFSLSCAPTGSGSGSLTVTTTTTGSNLDPDGYTVTIDGSLSQPIATNGSVTFTGPAGNHPAVLTGVASNCTVSGANPRTVTVPADGTGATTFSVSCSAQQPIAEVIGQGQIGMASPTPGNNVQTFDFDVRADLTGRFTITAYDDVQPDGHVAALTTDASMDPTTSITAYRGSSNVCSDPSRGVEFDAVGRERTGAVVSYTVQVCDNGPAGSGRDFFSFFLPSEQFGRSGIVTSGDVVKQ